MDRRPYRQRTRVRAGRTGSLLRGVMGLVMLVVGVSLMGGFDAPPLFLLAWIAVCLVITGMSFYNAFSEEGVSLYEIETDAPTPPPSVAAYCPQCGTRLAP